MTARPSRPGRRLAVHLGLVVAVIVVPFAAFGAAVEVWAGEAAGSAAPRVAIAMVIFGLLAADILAPVPSSFVCVAAGATLGVAAGTVVAASGLTCGCLLGFWLARRLGTRASTRVLGHDRRVLDAALRQWGLLVLVVCRPVPVLAEATVLLVGAAEVPLGRATAAVASANLGVAAVYSALGASADDAASYIMVFAASCLVPASLFGLSRLAQARRTPRGHRGRPHS